MNTKDYCIQKTITLCDEYEVIVVGGGPAGCAAAVASARHGAKTLLIEMSGMPGGMGTLGLVPAWCPFSDGKQLLYRGIAEEVFSKSRPGNCSSGQEQLNWVPIDVEKLKLTYDELLREAGVDVHFFSTVTDVQKSSDDMIDALIVGSRAGLTAYKAPIFIDATGDGDVAARAGVPFEIGGPDGKTQQTTLCFLAAGANLYDYQFSNYIGRVWSNENKEARYTHKSCCGHMLTNMNGNGIVGFNAGHMEGFRSDDIPALSRGMMDGRIIARDLLEDLKKFAPAVYAGAQVVNTAGAMGIREGRRFESDYQLVWTDYRDRRSFEDEIARNSYFVDIHGSTGSKDLEREIEATRYKPGESHGIPYRSLLPKGIRNLLLSGRCISADRIVYGSTRVMPVCLVTGQAAGTAAALAAEHGTDPRGVDPQDLRAKLRSDGAYFL